MSTDGSANSVVVDVAVYSEAEDATSVNTQSIGMGSNSNAESSNNIVSN